MLRTAREATGLADEELLAPAAPHVPVTLAELVFGVTHEGAADVADLLDRRTRVGLVPADRTLVEPLALRALVSTGPPDSPVRKAGRTAPFDQFTHGTIPAAMSSHGLAGRYEGGRLRRRA